ncbi:hypothetical protein BVY03_04435 [bacterium K02(2017)]|nr:hypothetical protein BVY03_04435 [bacterium K02(2017)]
MILITPVIFTKIVKQYSAVNELTKVGLVNSQDLFILLKKMKSRHVNFIRYVKNSNVTSDQNGSRVHVLHGIDNEKTKFEENIKKFIAKYKKITWQTQNKEAKKELVESTEQALEKYQLALQKVLANIKVNNNDIYQNINTMNRNYIYLERNMEGLISEANEEIMNSIMSVQNKSANQIKIFSIFLAIAIFITLAVGWFFSNYLSKPIQNLAKTIENVTQKGLYSQRVVKESEDEMGGLVDGFNQMLFELERTHNSLMSTREKFNNIFESINQMIVITNEKGLIKDLNIQAMTSLGYANKKDIKDKYLEHVLYNKIDENLKKVPFSSLLNKGNDSSFSDKVMLGVYGQPIQVKFSSSVLKKSNIEVVGVICIATVV